METLKKTGTPLKEYLQCMAAMRQDAYERQRRLKVWTEGHREEDFRSAVEAYLPWVVAWASPERGQGIGLEKLIALGNACLMTLLRSCPTAVVDKFEDMALVSLGQTLLGVLKKRL